VALNLTVLLVRAVESEHEEPVVKQSSFAWQEATITRKARAKGSTLMFDMRLRDGGPNGTLEWY
jgi:hypothetical protein